VAWEKVPPPRGAFYHDRTPSKLFRHTFLPLREFAESLEKSNIFSIFFPLSKAPYIYAPIYSIYEFFFWKIHSRRYWLPDYVLGEIYEQPQ